MKSIALPQKVENYHQLCDFLEQASCNDRIPRDNLKYFQNILALLDDPQNSMGKIIHVTGTNGKGSVTWKIARALEAQSAAETKVGLYVSPHIYDLEERITINGQRIAQADLVKHTNFVLAQLHKKSLDSESSYNDFRIGKVGILVCVAFLYFRDQQVDHTVIELSLIHI